MFEHKYTNGKNYGKVKDYWHYTGKYRGAAHSICNLKYSIPKEIHVVFHNGLNYDHHFNIEKLAKKGDRLINELRVIILTSCVYCTSYKLPLAYELR